MLAHAARPEEEIIESAWADHASRLHIALGGAADELPRLRELAIELLRAARRGDSCLRLIGRCPDSPLITSIDEGEFAPKGAPGARPLAASRPPGPWVRQWGHLYLHRLWVAETALADRLLTLCRSDQSAVAGPDTEIDRELQRLAAANEPAPEQLQAIQVGLTRRLLLLTGGPGTGKTFTLARLIDAVQRLLPQARIALAAPTGKAASRLAQAIGGGAATDFARVQTVHSLLGMRGEGQPARHGRSRPLAYDLVVVDESSMLGLELASQLLQALPAQARLVLAGDSEQLASVEPGSVFADLIRAGQSGLSGSVVRLTRNFRQREAPALASFSRALQQGATLSWPSADVAVGRSARQPDQAEQQPEQAEQTELAEPSAQPKHPKQISEPAPSELTFCEITGRQSGELASQAARRFAELNAAAADPRERLAQLNRYRVLCGLRTGPWGSKQLARDIDDRLRRLTGVDARNLWYDGRLVMLTRNLRSLGRVNGDVGLCHWHEEHLCVLFEDSAQAWSSIRVTQLAGVEPAWCLSVHKSQGSEFEAVDLVLPPKDSPLARRELVYTGATRARRQLRVWGDPASLAQAAVSSVERRGTLGRRLGD